MKRTYITKMPDKAGAFLRASRVIAEHGGNIVRVNYNKAVDLHTLFIEVSADEEQHKRILSELESIGYITGTEEGRQVILIVLKLPDAAGAVRPVLEVIAGYDVNISYMSSQENGTPYQYFKMGLLVENTDEIRRLLDDVSKICEVRIVEYDVTEKQLDGTVFYITFANEMRDILSLDQETTNSVLINSNRVMQILDERGETPLKTFDYIRRFAKFVAEHHGDEFHAEIRRDELSDGYVLYTVQPPCGSDTYILDNGGEELLFVDCGFACYRDEMTRIFEGLFPNFYSRRKTLVITHADIDHTGLCDMFDRVYMSASCCENFRLERAGEPNFREQNVLHAPYCVLSKIISGYRPPELSRAVVVGEKTDDGMLSYIGGFDACGLRFEVYEGAGGHVRGEVLIVSERLKLAFTGDILVNVKGFTKEQYDFNLLAPYLMTSVNVDSAKAKAIRGIVNERYSDYILCPGHGMPMFPEK